MRAPPPRVASIWRTLPSCAVMLSRWAVAAASSRSDSSRRREAWSRASDDDLVGLRLGVLEQALGPGAHLVRVVLGPLGELAQPGLALGEGGLLLLAARLELGVGRLAAGGERDLELGRAPWTP